MRVTGGEMSGRRLHVPRRGVRPTQDRVRLALFSSLGARIAGAGFLDLYAGSGAVGLDAWSRGAARVWWVESDRGAQAVLRRNVEEVCGPARDAGIRVMGDDVLRFVRRFGGDPFDIVYADPPYARSPADAAARAALLAELLRGGVLAADGVVVLEQGAEEPVAACEGWTMMQVRTYGDASLRYYVRGAVAGGGESMP